MNVIDTLYKYIEHFNDPVLEHLIDDSLRESRESGYHKGYSHAISHDEADEELLREAD